MKKWLQDFWRNPIKRRWVIIINVIGFALSFFTFHLLDKQINPWVSLRLIILALFCEILVFAFYVPDQLKEMWQDIKALIAWSNRDAMYHHYRLKHENKSYKGPDWEDEEFKEIPDLKERVDAFVKASIAYQQIDFERWKKRNLGVNLDHQSQTAQRILIITMATFISLGILFILYKWLKFDSDTISSLIKESRSPVVAALITTVITSPVIFIIWLFRDKNNRMQIENARKDTNLKDFQKLSEWASGFHLPETKQTKTIKNELKKDDSTAETKKEFKEEIESTEYFITPDDSNSINRRLGAEALQASAIAQLEAFMFGKYGEQFMQPAFLLIHAIWESIIIRYQAQLEEDFYFRNYLHILYRTPVVSSLNKALIGTRGMHLKLFEEQLININLTALNTNSSLFRINLSGYTLIGANLSFTNFCNCIFSGADLTRGNIKYALLKSASLQKAILNFVEASNANLSHSNLQSASLHNANLQSADLWGADLQLANLSGSQLKGANLKAAIFKNTDFEFASLNRKTQFGDDDLGTSEDKIRENVLLLGALWQDDPNWLNGKIQDSALMEKIIEYCRDRKDKGYDDSIIFE